MEEGIQKAERKYTRKKTVTPLFNNESTFTSESVAPLKPIKKKHFLKRTWPILLIILVVLLAGATSYLYKKTRLLQNPDQAAQVEAKKLLGKVGEIVVLPENEIPTIATVADPSALVDQPFFEGAKIGDKVLIFSVAKKAVLYDPVQHKVINIAPFSTETKPTTSPTSSTQKPTTTAKTDSKTTTR
jgi:hypothetical protein